MIEIHDIDHEFGHAFQSQETMQSPTSIKKVETFRQNVV